jgi:hypothetical protein
MLFIIVKIYMKIVAVLESTFKRGVNIICLDNSYRARAGVTGSEPVQGFA